MGILSPRAKNCNSFDAEKCVWPEVGNSLHSRLKGDEKLNSSMRRMGWTACCRGDGFPFVQELDYIILAHQMRPLKIAGAVEYFPLRIKHRQRWYAFLQVNMIFLRQIQVFVILSHVHTDNNVIVVQQRRDPGLMKCIFKDMAVNTPVAAKVQQHVLVLLA